MFTCVVYRNATDNSYSVQDFRDNQLDSVIEYSSIEALPDKIKNKVKQLLWVDPNDHSMTDTIGIRVGENAFWLLENDE